MVDRVIVYTGPLPQSTDILNTNKFGMFGLGFGMRMMLGTGTFFDGLACLPTSPTPDLHVTVGIGSIYCQDETDQAAYSDLGTDTSTIYKQGINSSIQTLTITPPSTGGYSQVFLVQAIIQDLDTGAKALSYFNASNPSSPYSGPANAGTSNYTIRQCNCVIALKAGTAATTGTQTTPAPDAGYTGLYAITVANGATQVTSGNIVQLSTAPIVGAANKLPQIPASVQSGMWLYGVDTGSANVMAAAVTPIPSAPVTGMEVHIKAAASCTGATTFNLNGTGAVAVKRANGAALSSGDINIGMVVGLIFDGTNWQIKNYFGFTSSSVNNNTYTLTIPYALDTSTSSNTITVAPSPAVTTLAAGQQIIVKLANPITGATTITINSLASAPVVSQTGQALTYGAGAVGEMLWMLCDGTNYQVINGSNTLQGNLTIYVNGSTGSDSYDGSQATVSGTKGPLQHIQTACNKASNYPPSSSYSVTIQVADGTYAEAVSYGPSPGPTLIVSGNVGSPSNVLVTGATSSHTFQVSGPNTLTVQNLKVTAANSGAQNSGFVAGSGATLKTSNTVSGAVNYAVFEASGPSSCYPGTHSFGGNSTFAFNAINGGFISLTSTNGNFTISTSITVSDFAAVVSNGNIGLTGGAIPSFTNPGNVTGIKYSATLNGVINTQGQGANYFPGTVAGVTGTGGQYN